MNNRGFIQAIFAIIVSLVILSFFGIDLQERFESPLFQKNMKFVWGLVQSGWNRTVNNVESAVGNKTATSSTKSTKSTQTSSISESLLKLK